jgi:predicted nuclease of predicted toxin-antitoxin system
MLKFIIDTQLPPILAHILSQNGYDAVHTTNFPSGHLMTDKQIIGIAITEQRVIITKDSDFFDYHISKGFPPKVLFVKLGNQKNNFLLKEIRSNLNSIVSLFNQCNMIVLTKEHLIAY